MTVAHEPEPDDLVAEVRRLRLDNEELRFECARLRAAVLQHQTFEAALARRNGELQHQVETWHRLTAWRKTRLFRFLARRML